MRYFPEFSLIILSGGYGSLLPRRISSSLGHHWVRQQHNNIMASAATSSSSSSFPVMGTSIIKVYTLGSGQQNYKKYITNQYIPPLVPSAYKGLMGRIGIIGGSPDYTGAPYYAAESALKFGSDLVFVFCAKEAAIPIKSYSPELMVTPFYEEGSIVSVTTANNDADADSCSSGAGNPSKQDTLEAIVQGMIDKVSSFFPRLHSLVIGPGLGRDPVVLRAVGRIIELARAASLPLVIDADGLWLVAQNTSVVHGYSRCILTPNAAEFDRLMAAVGLSLSPRTPPASDGTVKSDYDHAKAKCDRDAAAVHALSLALGGVTVVKKGATDIISSGTGSVLLVTEAGSMRRCGGQGDILAGCLGVATYWSGISKPSSEGRGGTVETDAASRASTAGVAGAVGLSGSSDHAEPSQVDARKEADVELVRVHPFEWANIASLASDGRTASIGDMATPTSTSTSSSSSSSSSSSNSTSSSSSNSNNSSSSNGTSKSSSSSGGSNSNNNSDGTSSIGSHLVLVATPSDLALVTPQMWSVALACAVTKRAGNIAFEKHHRAMTSPDVMREIGPAFHEFSTSTDTSTTPH